MAVVDWARTDVAARNEETGETEQLTNDLLRDRSITDAVNMVVQENQTGQSFMAGLANSFGMGVNLAYLAMGGGAASGLGASTASTSGVRDVTGNTAQQISDAFRQAATA